MAAQRPPAAALPTTSGPSKSAQRESCPSGGCSWQDLLPELLGLVLLRMPSHADRIRLRAVCRSWCSGARLQRPLPPPLPWIIFRYGSLLSLPDGRVEGQLFPYNYVHHVSTGNMIFLVHREYDEGRWCALMDPSSGQTTPQHIHPDVPWRKSPQTIHKVVVSDHMFALLFSSCRVTFCARGPQRAGSSCSSVEWALPAGSIIEDIALLQGKLYILSTTTTDQAILYRELRVMDFGPAQLIVPTITAAQCIRGTARDISAASRRKLHQYMVVSGDRLLMVEREVEMMRRSGKPIRTRRLKVFEATDLSGGDGRWRKVDTLMGNALFVSKECSASLPVDRHGGAQEDCVYFTCDFVLDSWGKKPNHCEKETNPEADFLNSGMWSMRNQRMMPLPIATTTIEKLVASWFGRGSQAWLFVSPNGDNIRI